MHRKKKGSFTSYYYYCYGIIPGIIINKCATLHNTYSCKKYNKSKIDLKLIYIEFIPSCF